MSNHRRSPTVNAAVPGSHLRTALDIDFTALATADYDHTAASLALGGYTFTQGGGTTYADDVDTTSGTGLVVNMGAASSTFDLAAQTMWSARIALSSIIPDFAIDSMVCVEAILDAQGDANTELHGIAVGTPATTFKGAGLGLGTSGGAAGCVRYRQQSTTVTTRTDAGVGSAVRIVYAGFSWWLSHGVADGLSFPTSWTRCPELVIGYNQQPSASVALDTSMEAWIWAATGNTSNNFAPVFKRLRIRYLPSISVYL